MHLVVVEGFSCQDAVETLGDVAQYHLRPKKCAAVNAAAQLPSV